MYICSFLLKKLVWYSCKKKVPCIIKFVGWMQNLSKKEYQKRFWLVFKTSSNRHLHVKPEIWQVTILHCLHTLVRSDLSTEISDFIPDQQKTWMLNLVSFMLKQTQIGVCFLWVHYIMCFSFFSKAYSKQHNLISITVIAPLIAALN